MSRFCIITPTIGRQSLKRCVESLDGQIFRDFIHIVSGDGPQNPWVGKYCAERKLVYMETPVKEKSGSYGAAPRNLALRSMPKCDYVFFLDDDNVLLEPALYQMNMASVEANDPPLLYQDIIPKSFRLVVEGEWDLLNGIYRSDVVRGVDFKPSYKNDFLFAQDVVARLPAGTPWIKVKGVGGIHHLSWDTYHG